MTEELKVYRIDAKSVDYWHVFVLARNDDEAYEYAQRAGEQGAFKLDKEDWSSGEWDVYGMEEVTPLYHNVEDARYNLGEDIWNNEWEDEEFSNE